MDILFGVPTLLRFLSLKGPDFPLNPSLLWTCTSLPTPPHSKSESPPMTWVIVSGQDVDGPTFTQEFQVK